MAETLPPNVEFNKGIYVPQLGEAFLISKDANYDYYSTNSGMYPKNPGGGSGGGGGDPSEEIAKLKKRMTDVENTQDEHADSITAIEDKQEKQSAAALNADSMLSNMTKDIEEIDNIVDNQLILSASQQTFLDAMKQNYFKAQANKHYNN